jgi:hypothetical protein
MSLSPILICTHTRIRHLEAVIESLLVSPLACETILYIFTDAPRNSHEENRVQLVRSFVDKISGFKEVIHIRRPNNFGHFHNFQEATREVFQTYDKIIKLEDDVIVGRFFLEYMNYYLDAFAEDENVVAISSNLWPDLDLGRQAALLLPLANGWGWGTWKEKFNEIDHSNALACEFINNKNLFFKMIFFNPSLLGMVNAVAKCRLVAGDVNWALHLIKYNKYVLFPPFSISGNLGFDGSGQNCHLSENNLYINYSNESFELNPKTESASNSDLKKIFKYFGGYRTLIKQLLLFFTEFLFGYSCVQSIVKLKAKIRENFPSKYFFF